MIEIATKRMVEFDALTLAKGSHKTRKAGLCAMEAAAWLAGEKHSDAPKCVSPVLRAFLVRWNDDLDDEGRQKLKPFIPRVLDTAGDGKDELRGWFAADWLVRVHTPAWLELAGVTDAAMALRALPPLRTLAGLKAALPTIDNAREKAAAARDAARDAAWAAARDAAWAAARDAAWAAAWGAAWAAARDAARDAARKKLEPTKVALQASALKLLDNMIRAEA